MPSRRLRSGFFLRLAAALLVTWLTLIGSLSYIYIHKLTSPACLPSSEAQPGFEPLLLETTQGIHLSGWWHAPQNGAVVLLLGGHGANRDTMLPEARMLVEQGFGILTLDGRHCAGKRLTLGYAETAELAAMAAYAHKHAPDARLGVLGFSAGGVTAILGAAEMPQIEAVAAMGNYANLHQEIHKRSVPLLSPSWQVQQMVSLFYTLLSGVRPRRVSPIDSLPQIAPRPVLLIQGEYEAGPSHAQDQYAAAGEPKELWVVPGVGHGGYYQAQPDTYEQRVIGFFEQNLAGR